MAEKINIAIVHFNTPKLTECLVRSINKFTPNSTIYIFDNSDKEPFTAKYDNVIIINNTKGQYINFNDWLKKYPERVHSSGKLNNWGSAKHCYSVEKCMEIIGEDFILLDSDVILKKDITPLFEKKYIYVGEVITQPKSTINRVLPFICYINTPAAKKNNVHYFNENYMHGLRHFAKNKSADYYDTGAYFYLSAANLPSKKIKWEDYCVHYGSASWIDERRTSKHMTSTKITEKDFIEKYRFLWDNDEKQFDDNKMSNYKEQLLSAGKRRFGKFDIDNPVTIQEKIQWLKLYDSTPLKTKCADKVKVHEYCKEKIGKDICIPIIKVYNKTSEIKWDELPSKFVIKCNHGSGMNIIVTDKSKLDKASAIQNLNKWMATDFAMQNNCELHYHNIERKIFVEEFKEDNNQKTSLFDYKFWCFNGVPKFMTVNDGHGHGKMTFFDMDFNPLKMQRTDFETLPNVKKPINFDKMAEYAKKLSEDFKFVRVDFYEINGEVYLGELTFTPGSGFFKYRDPKDNKIVGDMLDLGIKKNKKVIYTCITGAYELLDDPFVISPGYDYVCFTNYCKIKSNIWQIRPIPKELDGLSEVKKQRCIKICPHKYLPEYDFSIWVDGSVKLKRDVNTYVNQNIKNGSVFIPRHPRRNCIYEECKACINMKKDKPETINAQKERYIKEGFPKDFGLVQSNIVLRYHNEPDCIKLMDAWWNEVKNGSHRDQLSFNYALWKNPDTKFVYVDKNLCVTDYFKWDNLHGRKKSSVAATRKTTNIPVDYPIEIKKTARTVVPTVKKPALTNSMKEEIREKAALNLERKRISKPTISVTPSVKRKLMSRQLKIFLRA